MKKIYSFIVGAFVSTILIAQPSNINTKPLNTNPQNTKYFKTQNKTTSCIDTVYYPFLKLTGSPEIGTMNNDPTWITGIAQAYNFTGNATVSGIRALVLLDLDGIPNNAVPILAKIAVYNVSAGYPTNKIDSAMVQVLDVGMAAQNLMFSSPVSVNDTFAIAIEMGAYNAPTDSIIYATNTYGSGSVNDGNGEALSSILSPFYGGWFNNLYDLGGWDIDFLISPIININTTADFNASTDTVCLGMPVSFSNNSVLITDSAFNLSAYAALNNYDWDLGDGNTSTLDSLSHTYSSGGAYQVQLKANYYGYTIVCADSTTKNIVVIDSAKAGFSITDNGGGSYTFADSSMNGSSYTWDFGDTVITSGPGNINHTYTANGTYTVCLTVADANGCFTDSVCKNLTVVAVGINQLEDNIVFKTYPNPVINNLTVEVAPKYSNDFIVINDVLGKEIKRVAIDNNPKFKINLNNLSKGVYYVSLEQNGSKILTNRIFIR